VKHVYRRTVLVFGLLAIGLGFAILIETSVRSGGSVGYVLGCLFIALGAARLYLLRRT
jgi:uncharacterized membrane protein HdeD (DUF308 family)